MTLAQIHSGSQSAHVSLNVRSHPYRVSTQPVRRGAVPWCLGIAPSWSVCGWGWLSKCARCPAVVELRVGATEAVKIIGTVIRGAGCTDSARLGLSVAVMVIGATHHGFQIARGEICSNSWLPGNPATWVEISCSCDPPSMREVHTTPGTFRSSWRPSNEKVQQNRCGC